MDIQFFRAEPDAPVDWPRQSSQADEGDTPGVVLVPLERHNDPDATNHDGFDYYGAYGSADLIDDWAEGQLLEPIDRDQMPAVLTHFPAPFNEA